MCYSKFLYRLTLLSLATATGCGSHEDQGLVAIPSVSFACSRTSAACNGITTRSAKIYWTTAECKKENMSSSYFQAQASITLDPTTNCASGDKCSDTAASWTDSSGTTLTKINADEDYNVCILIDSTEDGTVGNTGDYRGSINGVTVNGATATQTLNASDFSVL